MKHETGLPPYARVIDRKGFFSTHSYVGSTMRFTPETNKVYEVHEIIVVNGYKNPRFAVIIKDNGAYAMVGVESVEFMENEIIEVMLNNEYSATFLATEDYVTVGCQKIPKNQILVLANLIKEHGN